VALGEVEGSPDPEMPGGEARRPAVVDGPAAQNRRPYSSETGELYPTSQTSEDIREIMILKNVNGNEMAEITNCGFIHVS